MHSRMEFQYQPVPHQGAFAIERHVVNVLVGESGRPIDVTTVRRHIVASGFASMSAARAALRQSAAS
jgi:hypothetical protein